MSDSSSFPSSSSSSPSSASPLYQADGMTTLLDPGVFATSSSGLQLLVQVTFSCPCPRDCPAGVSPEDHGSGGVNTFNGVPLIASRAVMSSRGYNLPFSTELTYFGNDPVSGSGFTNEWLCSSLAGLEFPASTVMSRPRPLGIKEFVPSGGVYKPSYFLRDTLSAVGGGWTMMDPSGVKRTFDTSGMLTGMQAPGATSFERTVAYEAGTGIRHDLVQGGITGSKWRYEFTWDATNSQIVSVVYSLDLGAYVQPVLKSEYGYSSGKLITVKTYENSATGGATPDWGTAISAERFTYHTGSGLLRHVVPPAEYLLMQRNGLNPDDTNPANLSQFDDYAETEYAYDGANKVATLYTHGRRYQRTYTYAAQYWPGTSFNDWRFKTVINKPGNVRETVYLNVVGQVILKKIEQLNGSGVVTDAWYPVYQKFEETTARIVLSAEGSAIVGPINEATPGLISLSATNGLITHYEYDSNGLRSFVKLTEGTGGAPSPQKSWTYVAKTAAGSTIYLVASEKTYADAGDSVTSWVYVMQSGALQPSKVTKTLPVIPTNQNGSGVANTEIADYNIYGYLTKTTDSKGIETVYVSDPLRNGVTSMIQDPSGLNLVTDYQLDDLGRTIRELGPPHTVDLGGGSTTSVQTAKWVYYRDREHEVWTFGGYRVGTTETVVGAVTIQITNVGDTIAALPSSMAGYRMDWTVSARYTGTGLPSPTGSFTSIFPRTGISNTWEAWSIAFIDKAMEWRQNWSYWSIPLSTSGDGYGTLDSQYGRKTLNYDSSGRQNETTCPGGTTDRTTYNAMGWATQEELGTSAGMTVTKINGYDQDGNRISVTKPIDGTSANDRVTTYTYDYRHLLTQEQTVVEVDGGTTVTVVVVYTYEVNRPLLVAVESYYDSTANRISYTTTARDLLGRVYKTTDYQANPTSYPHPLISNTFYDADGRVVQDAPAGSRLFTTTAYDAIGRITTVSKAYWPTGTSSSSSSSSAASAWNPADVTYAVVMEQIVTVYDEASNVKSIVTRQRYDDATGEGDLHDPSTLIQPCGRFSYVASYPDAIGRVQARVDYGTNGNVGGTSWRPPTIPTRSTIWPSTREVISYDYDAMSRVITFTDAAGVHTCTTYDKLGRITYVRENCLGNSSSSSSSSGFSTEVRATSYEYTSDSWMKKMTCENGNTGDQVTEWIYGVTPAQGSGLYSNRQIYQKVFPSASGTGNRRTYIYNRQLQMTQKTDQAGTIHLYGFDRLGRLLTDTISTFGSGVDNVVGKLETAYNGRGLQSRATSYNTAGTIKLNEVAWDYNAFDQVIAEYQEHSSGGVTSNTLKIGYSYEDGTGNTIRRKQIKYPFKGTDSSTTVDMVFSTQMADALSRVDQIKENGSAIQSSWRYVGLNMVIAQKYDSAGTSPNFAELTYGSSATGYSGYDQFGRIAATLWKAGSTGLVNTQYGRDAGGNVLWRYDYQAHALSVTTQDSFYSYDSLYQVRRHTRGNLGSGTPPYSGVSPEAQAEDIAYDETGNWTTYHNSTAGLYQTRLSNIANQYTHFDPDASLTPTYSPPGNMTAFPKTDAPSTPQTATWDAWNRMVTISESGTLKGSYTYDALHRRIKKVSTVTRYHFYDDQWRSIQDRDAVGYTGTAKTENIFSPFDRWNLIRRKISISSTFDETHYILRDYLDPVAVIGTTANVIERYSYDAFGSVTRMNASYGSTTLISQRNWLFHGEIQDFESGLYNYGYRYYHPGLGRWLSRDPIGEAGGYNIYQFVSNRPLFLLDIFGLAEVKVGFAFVGHQEGGENRWFYQAAGGCDDDPDFGGIPANPLGNRSANGMIGSGLSGKDFLEFLQSVSQGDNCIKNLRVATHCSYDGSGLGGGGGPDEFRGFYLSKDIRDPDDASKKHSRPVSDNAADVNDLKNLKGQGKIKFCTPCSIYVFACSSPGAENFIKGLADATGCTVVGAIGGESQPEGKGQNSNKSKWHTDGKWKQSVGGAPLTDPETTNDGHTFDPTK